MVGAIELGLLVNEFLLNLRIQRVERVEELAPTDAVEACPVAQRSQRRIRVKPRDARRHMTSKARQHRLHVQLALTSNDLLLQGLLILEPRHGQWSTPSVNVLHAVPRQMRRTREVAADFLVGETEVAPHLIPHTLLSRDGQRKVDAVERHPIDEVFPLRPVPPGQGVTESAVIQEETIGHTCTQANLYGHRWHRGRNLQRLLFEP